MTTTVLLCPRCEIAEVIRYGKAADGKQRFRCRSCIYTFREDPQPNGYTEEQRAQIPAAYPERSSLRGLNRIFQQSVGVLALDGAVSPHPQVVAYVLDDRGEQTCRRLWQKIPEDYRGALCYTDFWRATKVFSPRAARAGG